MAGCEAARWLGSAAGPAQVELVGLVVDLDGDFSELVTVSAGVMPAKKQIATAGEHHAYIRLGTAAVASV